MFLNDWRLVMLWRMLGLAPVKYKDNCLIYSKIMWCFASFYYLLMTFGDLHYAYQSLIYFKSDHYFESFTQLITRMGDVLCLNLTIATFLIYANYNCKEMLNIAQAFMEFDKFLNINEKHSRVIKFIAFSFILILIYITVHAYSVLLMSNQLINNYILMYVNEFFVSASGTYWLNIVFEVERRFRAVNRKLSTVLIRKCKIDMFPRTRPQIREGWNEQNLEKLIDIHHRLCDAMKRLAEMCGVQLIIYLLYVVYQIISIQHNIIVMILNTNGSMYDVYLVSRGIKLIIRISQILYVIWPCELCIKQADNIVNLLLRYRNKCDDFTKRKIDSFLIVPNTNGFNLCGLFNLNLKGVTTIITIISTYLVIIVQFEEGEGLN